MRWAALCVLIVAMAGSSTATASAPPPCPAEDATRPTGAAPGDDRLVDPGAVAVRVCRYFGLNAYGGARARQLDGSGTISAAGALERLTADLNALPTPPAGAVACPADDGSRLFALLEYPDGTAEVVVAEAFGCRGVSNGDVERVANGDAGNRVLAQLDRATRRPCPAATGRFARGRTAKVSDRHAVSCSRAYRVIRAYDRRYPTHSRRPTEALVGGFDISYDPRVRELAATARGGARFIWREYGR